MIIDIHAHVWQRKYIPEKFWLNFAANFASMLDGASIESIMNSSIMKSSFNGSPERLIKEMDKANIDKTVIFGCDWGLYLGEAEKSIIELNEYVMEAQKEYPDRLIGFFTIDPRRKDSEKIFEEFINKGLKGLKLHPTTGYLADGSEAFKLYKKAIEHDVPILSHLGYITGLLGNLARPKYFDKVTTEMPDLKICLAHMNYGEIDDLISLMFSKANVFCDISAHGQIAFSNSPSTFYLQLKELLNYSVIQKKVMFGSDWPMTNSLITLKKWKKTIENLPSNEKANEILDHFGHKRFNELEIKKVLGKNAQNFLKSVL